MTKTLSLLGMVFALLVSSTLLAQDIATLPTPDRISSDIAFSGGGTGIDPGTILVGAIPPNAGNKPVLVFIHGYQGSANTWLPEGGNDMYSIAYNNGHRTAFVTVYDDKNMWDNGSLFASMLPSITNYYGVNEVVVVAHSKGGLDTDAALIHYGAYPYVDRVITLSSPHWGSPLGDLAQSGWTSWLGALFGQNNDATYVLQTGYMNYFRSITDPHANRPYTSFRTLGGWDYDYFSSLGTSGSYLSSSGYSYMWGGGGNDGVVPYVMTRRPNSTELYWSGSSRTKWDHYEINQGGNVWVTINEQLPGTLYRGDAVPTTEIGSDYNPTQEVGSRSIVLASADGAPLRFTVDEGTSNVRIDIRTMEEGLAAKVTNSGARLINLQGGETVLDTEGILGKFVSQYTMEAPESGKYDLEVEGAYIAVITMEGGGEARFRSDLQGIRQVYRAGETMRLTMNLNDANGSGIEGASIDATVRLTANLEGQAPEDEVSFAVEFRPTNVPGEYVALSRSLPMPGVYNITMDAKKGDFHRSVVHSVGVIENDLGQPITTNNAFDLSSYPNPFQGSTNIRFTLEGAETVSLQVMDLMGRTVQAFDLEGYGEGTHSITWDASDLNTGTYLIRMQAGSRTQTQKVQVIR